MQLSERTLDSVVSACAGIVGGHLRERANRLSAMAKRYAIAACQRAISMAMEVHGSMGISRELGLERLFRDCRMLPIPDGTNQILTLIEGRELTGIAAYRT